MAKSILIEEAEKIEHYIGRAEFRSQFVMMRIHFLRFIERCENQARVLRSAAAYLERRALDETDISIAG